MFACQDTPGVLACSSQRRVVGFLGLTPPPPPPCRRAYELGATNDGWWEDMAASFELWDKAIAEAGVDWKYRQVP